MTAWLPETYSKRERFVVKKFILSTLTVVGVLGATTVPVFADVIHSNGTSGKPIAHGSNPGSVQAQQHRSVTGTQNKSTHDGWIWVIE